MSVSFSFDWEYMPDELIGEIMSAFADSREVLFDGQLQIVVEMEDGELPGARAQTHAPLRAGTSLLRISAHSNSFQAPPGAILRDSTHFY